MPRVLSTGLKKNKTRQVMRDPDPPKASVAIKTVEVSLGTRVNSLPAIPLAVSFGI